MTKIFISGSINIQHLDSEIIGKFNEYIQHNYEILIGDAKGVDTLTQDYFASLGYYKVTVYCIGDNPRFLGSSHFNIKKISYGEVKNQEYKDKKMTEECDTSLVIWNGESKGSYGNIQRSLSLNKKTFVFFKDGFIKEQNTTKEYIATIFEKNHRYSLSDYLNQLKEKIDGAKNTKDIYNILINKGYLKDKENFNIEYSDYIMIKKNRREKNILLFKKQFLDKILVNLIKKNITKQGSLF